MGILQSGALSYKPQPWLFPEIWGRGELGLPKLGIKSCLGFHLPTACCVSQTLAEKPIGQRLSHHLAVSVSVYLYPDSESNPDETDGERPGLGRGLPSKYAFTSQLSPATSRMSS